LGSRGLDLDELRSFGGTTDSAFATFLLGLRCKGSSDPLSGIGGIDGSGGDLGVSERHSLEPDNRPNTPASDFTFEALAAVLSTVLIF
jgi:hypothetical protein